jgi:TRAP transporter TAXI family solute receptor
MLNRKGGIFMKRSMGVWIVLLILVGFAAGGVGIAIAAEGGLPEGSIDASKVTNEVVMGTAATSGMYYFVGAAVGNAVDKNSAMHVLVQSTAGSMENMAYSQTAEIDIGMGNADALYGAYNGQLSYEKAGKQDVLQIASLYTSGVHLFARADSDIRSWEDLRGKKVSLGAAGTTYVYFCQQIMKKYGIDWEKDLGSYYYMDTGEAGSKLVDGDIDAGFLIGGPPLAGLETAIASTPLRFIPMDQKIIDEMLAEFPYFNPYTMKANTYTGQDYDVKTIGLMTCFFSRAELSNEVVYAFVKSMMDSLPSYQNTNSATREISPETVWKSVIPLHPGAELYYREQGWIK